MSAAGFRFVFLEQGEERAVSRTSSVLTALVATTVCVCVSAPPAPRATPW
ncbi:hypothetical protein KYY02_04975 [Streptomyces pimonensis]|uniref:Uncharacterized protein n=1 Tax=Streptomyces pimonensis TaxID=2860288 RepID=A0ABV4ITT4_9ACTN